MKMKIQKKSDNDRFSALPDHVLLHIIEFMNTKHSVQTCVLSKRWKSLWKSLANLKLHHSENNKSDIFNKFVSLILSGRDDSLPLHSLSYEYDNAVDCLKTTLLEVMKYAASHNVQQLTVNVENWTIKDLEFPPSIFNSYSLTFLKLHFLHPGSYACMFPKSLNLPALKTLYLNGLTFTTSDNGYIEPFSTCNMLSTLVILDWYLQDDAHTLSISNSNVSSLTIGSIRRYRYKQPDNFKVVFCTPKLTSLAINGHPIFSAPSACNLPFLEEVNINYSRYVLSNDRLIATSWLQFLANVKILTLGFTTLDKMLMVLRNNDSMRNQLPCFVRLKSLKVYVGRETISTEEIIEIIEMVAYLLQDSPPLVAIDIVRKGDFITFRFEAADMMDRAIHLEDSGGGTNVDYN